MPPLLLPLLALVPWVGLVAFVLLRVRPPRALPFSRPEAYAAPLVSVVVPARNEALDIEACVGSLAASDYPAFEVIVVDDGSDDGTGELARAVGPGRAERLLVLDGEPLPEGWLGKPWACVQGVEAARGDILLFTDADTIHAPDLMGRAVAAVQGNGTDLLSVTGRQILGSFWERLVQPQVFFTMLLRFHDVERATREGRWRDAIANGQYMMFPRASYEAVGGHEAVKDAVVEDLSLAQKVVRSGGRLTVRMAEEGLATRMYRSLGELIRGWAKNIHMGALQTLPPRVRPLLPVASLLTGVGLWIVPPVVFAAGMAGWGVSAAWTAWATVSVALSLLLWSLVYHELGVAVRFAFLYPIGAAVGTWIYLQSWRAGERVEWKGRSYRLDGVRD